MIDPIVLAAATGVVVSPVAGTALLRAYEVIPERWRRTSIWLLVGTAVSLTAIGQLWPQGRLTQLVFIVLLGAVPGITVYILTRTALASALASLIPMYFGIGALTLGRPLHTPETALDRAMPLQPEWMLAYGSLYVFVVLPLFVIREHGLFRCTMKAWLTVVIVAYLGFVLYPTVAPRPLTAPIGGFAAWCLQLQYSADWRYNCFPSLHVAHSFVSALASYRVHKGVGIAAVVWATLIAISTVYTKQHYVVDVIGGTLIAYAAYMLYLRGYPREAIPERDRHLAPSRALFVVAMYSTVVVLLWVFFVVSGFRRTIVP